MSKKEIIKHYQKDILSKEKIKAQIKRKIIFISIFRLILFITAAIFSYYSYKSNNYNQFTVLLIIFIIFFLLILKYHHHLIDKQKYLKIFIQNLQNEINGLNYDFSAFNGAEERIQGEHNYSYDLDLFGDNSFFQSINRTITSFGKNYLAKILLNPFTNTEKIIKYQNAIGELSKHQDFIQHFRAIGLLLNNNDNINEDIDIYSFSRDSSHKNYFYKNPYWKILVYFIPFIYLILLLLCIFHYLSFLYFIPLWIITFFISAYAHKSVEKILTLFDKKNNRLKNYISLFKLIENGSFNNSVFKEIRSNLLNQSKASSRIKEIEKYCSNLLIAQAYPVNLLFNPILLWNVRYIIKIEKWVHKYQNEILYWFEALAHFEALTSLSIFAYNHPNYVYPIPNKDHFLYKGKQLGHPLIKEEVCVRNDISIEKDTFFLVITGANMAGKSTYLRTIGINHILACIGAPVFADSLEFTPCNLITSLRTSDSLIENESYFYSELKRLKIIIDRLNSGEQLFIILDEILKGTNSLDKQKGSLALMKQLIALKGNGIIATHDLILGELEKEYPDNIRNYCFEADIKEDHLIFTYKIREGIAHNMNACFLMKKIGIIGI